MIFKSNLQVGQVLWLKVRNQIDVVSDVIHPMLIAKIEKIILKLLQLIRLLERCNVYIMNITSL